MTAPGGGIPDEQLAALLDSLVPPVEPPPACTVCGERLDPALAAEGTHPLCDPTPAAPEQPPSTMGELAHALVTWERQQPRSLQSAVGPSELAVPCDRRLAYGLRNIGEVGSGRVPWAPLVGTAVHKLIHRALVADNQRLNRQRWLLETKVWPDEVVFGHCDAYDTDTDMVLDWKVVGPSTLDKVRPGPRTPDRKPSQQYIGQGQLYGRGWERAGRTPRWVRIVFLPRTTFFEDGYEWTTPYDREVAEQLLARMYALDELLSTLNVGDQPAMWAAVPAAPGDECRFCPWARHATDPADATGCPGDVDGKAKRLNTLTEGVIPAGAR